MKSKYIYGSLASYIDVSGLSIPTEWDSVFGRQAPLEVEIGFGTGEYIVGLAKKDRSRNFLGLEQSAERVIKGLRKVHEAGLTNVRLALIDAAWAFDYFLLPRSVEQVHCLFPCPWPKKRHAKHRLFSTDFLRIVNSRLVDGGGLRLVTDHGPYADWIVEGASDVGFGIDRGTIPASFGTKFEKKWSAGGQQMFNELVFRKNRHVESKNNEVCDMRTYFLETIDPANVEFAGLSGPVSIEFKDFLFDAGRARGMVQAIVTEDRRTQYLWLLITRTAKGWCLCAAPGSGILPTDGVRQALELAQTAFLKSGQKS